MEKYISFSIERILAMPCRISKTSTSFIVGDTVPKIKQEQLEDASPLHSPICYESLSETSKKPRKRLKMETSEQEGTYQADTNNNNIVRRCKLTQEQKDILENVFSRKCYLDPVERLYYSKQLGMTEAQIQTWFQNKRYKVRTYELMLCGRVPSRLKTSKSSNDSDKPQCKVGRCDGVDCRRSELIPLQGDIRKPGHEDQESKTKRATDDRKDKERYLETGLVNDYHHKKQAGNEKHENLPLPRVSNVYCYDALNDSIRLRRLQDFHVEKTTICYGQCCQSYGHPCDKYVVISSKCQC